LQTKIGSITTIKYNGLAKVYSYKWKEKYLTPDLHRDRLFIPLLAKEREIKVLLSRKRDLRLCKEKGWDEVGI
jgi:hypothetical protein